MKNKFEIQSGTDVIIPEIGKFPGGEIRVKLPSRPSIESRITAYLFNSDDVMTLAMIVNAMRNMGVVSIRLTMPYIPYARQDRVCNEGEAFSIKVFAKIINSLEFASVSVWDAHSDVSTKLIERCIDVPSEEIMKKHKMILNFMYGSIIGGPYPIYLVSPDKGAIEKTKSIANAFPQVAGIIFADKERDLATGKIIRTVVKDLPDDIANARLLIADDICDGGRTFIELAKVLRPYCYDLSLYVTHGIFSQGMEVFEPFYDNVWCTVNFKDYQ